MLECNFTKKFEVLGIYLSISLLCYFVLLLHYIQEETIVLFTLLQFPEKCPAFFQLKLKKVDNFGRYKHYDFIDNLTSIAVKYEISINAAVILTKNIISI